MEKSKASSGKRKKKASGSAEELPEAPVQSIHVLLQVHLWTERGGDAPPSAHEMVGDLLSASPCEVRDGSSLPITASFMEPALAVKTAWRLRRLVQGFSQASKTGHLGGCFILSNLEDSEPEVPLVQRFPALTRRHSGQVLLVGSLCESVRGIPGLRFEAVSDEWMTPEAIRLYRAVLELSAPVQMEAYAEEPAECWAPAIEAMPQAAEREETRVPPLVAEAPATVPAATRELPLAAARAAAAPPPRSETGQDIAGFSRTKVAAERRLPLRWIAVGGAAVVVVAAVAMMVPRSKRQEPSVKQSVPQAADPVPAAKPAAPPPLPTGPPAAPVAVEKPVKAKVPEPPQVPAPKPKADNAAHAQAAEPQTARPGDLKFTADEISRMLSMADKDAGDGDYDKAIQEYDTALKYDPSNARAKEGRARAMRNKGAE